MSEPLQLNLSEITIEPIRANPGRLLNFCGLEELDEWFGPKAHDDHVNYRVRVYCAYRPGSPSPVGFYALSIDAVKSQRLRPIQGIRLVSPIPAVSIYYVGVQRIVQRQGLGKLLLANALLRSAQIAEQAGYPAVVLRAATRDLIPYYEGLGFDGFDAQDPHWMLIPVRKLVDLARETEERRI